MIRRISHGTVRTVDLLVAIWLVVCVVVGVLIAQRVNRLGALGDGLVSVGDAISSTSSALQGVADVPLIGGGLESIVDQIDEIGQAATEQGEAGKAAALRLGVGLGLLFSVALTLPFLVVWVPIRVVWERDRRAIRRAVEAEDDGVQAYLAHRAVGSYPYRRLASVSSDPWADLRNEHYEGLASLEIDRLGLIPPSSR